VSIVGKTGQAGWEKAAGGAGEVLREWGAAMPMAATGVQSETAQGVFGEGPDCRDALFALLRFRKMKHGSL
jgi:hypothetical protein